MKVIRMDGMISVISRILAVIKISTMKLFESVEKFFRLLGISLGQNQSNPLNLLIVAVLMCLAEAAICVCGFLLFRAETISEYGLCFYGTASTVANLVYLSTTITKMRRTSKLIETFKRVIQRSICWMLEIIGLSFLSIPKMLILQYFRID